MVKKIVVPIVAAIMAAVVTAFLVIAIPIWIKNSRPTFEVDRVIVNIKAEYKQEFLSKEFKIQDFEWDNIERIEYEDWLDALDSECGSITIYLKKHGKKRVIQAREHFETLDFVDSVNLVAIVSIFAL